MKIEFGYMYRDGDNYKRAGSLLINAPKNITKEKLEEIEWAFRCTLSDGDYFIAHQVGVPECFNWDPHADYDPDDPETYPDDLGPGRYMINECDHCWHEFDFIRIESDERAGKPVDEGASEYDGSLRDLLKAFRKANKDGWQVFDIEERRCPGYTGFKP